MGGYGMTRGRKEPPTLRQTEVFLAVAELRSVRAAAEELGMSTKGVYHAVHGFLARCRNLS
jgi:molybdenum-dependent DNA-binding transcriptional regulator ModE